MSAVNGIPYTLDFSNYSTNGKQVQSDCNEILFINQGTCPVRVKGTLLLQTGDYWGTTGNVAEFDTTVYDILFQPTAPGQTQDLVVIRKTYNSNPGSVWVQEGPAGVKKMKNV